MTTLAIRAEGIGKRYSLRQHLPYHTIRDSVTNFIRRSLSLGQSDPRAPETFWALRDVSFEVRQGEILGLIGRNGAGKTTLLKILSGIIKPTTGFAELRGRMRALLEVGTGFHPELTGKENIFLNGVILGMSREDISRRFDEIVDFSDLEKFLDTPVKHYSAGMRARLAFAVGAHLEPEILLVDEVLSVGDIEFQKKCLGKMTAITGDGRTVIFVSHNLGAVSGLCDRALLIEDGSISFEGAVDDVISRYISSIREPSREMIANRRDRSGDGRIRLTSFHMEDASGNRTGQVKTGDEVHFVIGYEHSGEERFKNVIAHILIKDEQGHNLIHHGTDFTGTSIDNLPPSGQVVFTIPRLPLMAGSYTVNLYIGILDSPCDMIADAASFLVGAGNYFGTGHQGVPGISRLFTDGHWELRDLP